MAKHRGWKVVLTGTDSQKRVIADTYGGDYFPRKFWYKKDAKDLRDRVRGMGCPAEVQPATDED